MPKLIIIGIDGGSLNLINKWEDSLPSLKKIMRQDNYGYLESTIPPITCPAWVSMFTGLNPAELGMYYFSDARNGGHIFTSNDWWHKSVFKGLNDGGYSTGLLNLPITYPPPEVEGYLLSGAGTPAGVKNYSYPDMKLKDYTIVPPAVLTERGREKEYSKLFMDTITQRIRVSRRLMEDYPCDIHATVFFTIDCIQHYFWHHFDNQHPWYREDSEYKGYIKKSYQKIDGYIGEIMDDYPDSKIIIASDHGFCAFKGLFSINRWLMDNGYLYFKEKPKVSFIDDKMEKTRNALIPKLSPKTIKRISSITPDMIKRRMSTTEAEKQKQVNLLESIDWGKSTAYSLGVSGCVYFKDASKVDEIRDGLSEAVRGKGIQIFSKKEVYEGVHYNTAPELVLVGDGFCPTGQITEGLWSPPFASGMHSLYGLYMFYNIEKSYDRLKISDIAGIIRKAV